MLSARLPRPFIPLRFHGACFSCSSRAGANASTKFCPYKTLNVTTTASPLDIKKAYISRVFDLHPDRLAARPNGAPTPGSAEHKRVTTEFIQTVKSFELLSDEKRRREYDLDAARGDTGRYASEAAGRAADSGSHGWKADYNWDPRQRQQGKGTYGGFPGAAYDAYYYGPMNKGPIYMANWKMAMLVILVAALGSSAMMWRGRQRMAAHREAQEEQDRIIGAFYRKKKQEAEERGFDGSLERVRALDKKTDG
ncbi:hypothetical protein HDU98_003214 [Podochytrium sp. JEL0797]|nr:hypothetical protein HDU98_003214 [Podochytrium sp. JEL0797]